jgi:hypothetical protein
MSEEIAAREWHTQAIVRFTKDTTVVSVEPSRQRTYHDGEEVTMIQWGRAGRPIDRSHWWSSADIDGAFIVKGSYVEIVKILDEILPYDAPPTTDERVDDPTPANERRHTITDQDLAPLPDEPSVLVPACYTVHQLIPADETGPKGWRMIAATLMEIDALNIATWYQQRGMVMDVRNANGQSLPGYGLPKVIIDGDEIF